MAKGDFVPESSMHPPQWMLDLFAEGVLAPAEQAEVEQHLGGCPQCAAEVEACRSMIATLGSLPRFEPDPGFADAVMARVQTQPATLSLRIQGWLPETRRGWVLLSGALLAPVVPVVMLIAWLLSHPMVTTGGLMDWVTTQGLALASSAAGGLSRAVFESGIAGWIPDLITVIAAAPAGLLIALVLIAALALPVAGWSLFRLLRTPNGETTYAH